MGEVKRKVVRFSGPVASVQVARRCPHCGQKLYEKLEKCSGTILIKCNKCGKAVSMNLALRMY